MKDYVSEILEAEDIDRRNLLLKNLAYVIDSHVIEWTLERIDAVIGRFQEDLDDIACSDEESL